MSPQTSADIGKIPRVVPEECHLLSLCPEKSRDQKDSKDEDMELCTAPVRPQPADVKTIPIVESFTERFFANDIGNKEGSANSSNAPQPCKSEECCVRTKNEVTLESKEEICTLKTSLVSEKIQSFSESFHTSLKLNERVDSSNDTCHLDIDKNVSSGMTPKELEDLSNKFIKTEIVEENKVENDIDLHDKNIEQRSSSDLSPTEPSSSVTEPSTFQTETSIPATETSIPTETSISSLEASIPTDSSTSPLGTSIKTEDSTSPKETSLSSIEISKADEINVCEKDESKNDPSEESPDIPPEQQIEVNKFTNNVVKPTENSLYPKVVVKRDSGKDVEEIEFKEIKKEVRIVEPTESRKSSAAFVAERDITSILEDANAVLSQVAEPRFQAEPGELRVAVVGAGPGGLCAARHLTTRGFRAEVYEQCPDIGGTWVYSEEPASGLHHLFPLHSSLYHDLWTNLPKEAMKFPDFDYPDDGTSYLPSEKILQYLVSYADHFDLHPIIKVKHQVKRVAPVGKGWGVTVEDLITKTEDVSYFDAVMICSGPNNIPVYPAIEGIAKFSGKQIHSRDYRRAETYTGKRVLIMGLGPSGLDITYQLAKTAKQVILSHNKTKTPEIEFPKEVVLKPKVSSLFDRTVTFTDGTTEDVDVVIYCTGYTYNFPFLTEDCGIIVDQYVGPLYKHLINIERPTMCIIGLPKYCPHQYMVDYQVRAYLNILLGESKIPTKEEMLADLESDKILRNSEGQRRKDYHKLGKGRTKQYMDDLAKLGGLEPVEPVMFSLFHDAFVRAIRDFKGFRNYVYKILDTENFEVHTLDEKKE